MLEAISYQSMTKDVKINSLGNGIIGILIAHPGSEFVRVNIIDRISQFHYRSGSVTNFYLPGYGAYWGNQFPDAQVVCTLDKVEWSFSTSLWSEFLNELKSYSKYVYSGETELILLEVSNGEIDFSRAMYFWLDRMVADGAIFSVPNFFETIFRTIESSNSIIELSDKMALQALGTSLLEIVDTKLPIKSLVRPRHFCVLNISR